LRVIRERNDVAVKVIFNSLSRHSCAGRNLKLLRVIRERNDVALLRRQIASSLLIHLIRESGWGDSQ